MGKKARKGSGYYVEGSYIAPGGEVYASAIRQIYTETWTQEIERRVHSLEVHIQELAERIGSNGA